MIVDSDVLIWYFRGNENARSALGDAMPFGVSAITVMELLQGARDKAEQRIIHRQLRAWNAEIVHVSEAISLRALQFVNDFALSHSMAALDALIAGTAIESGGELLTANTKHFEYVPGLNLRRFRP